MIGLETFKLNRILLLIVGLWPFEQSNVTRLQFILFSIILTSIFIFQLMTFITSKCTPKLITTVLPTTFFSISLAIKYNFFRFNIKAMKDLMMQLQDVCDGLKDKNEIAIMEEYCCTAKRYTTVVTIFGIGSIFILFISLFWSNIFNIILPMNISSNYRIPIMIEYFIDQEKYFYYISLHISLVICIGAIATVAIGSMLLTYIQHTCGMFKISSYRIKRAVHINTLEITKSEKESLILKGIINAVDIHQQAIKLIQLLISKVEIMMFCLITIGVISLSLNLFRIVQITSSGDDVKEILFPIVFIFIIISYMFIGNYVAQEITDHNNNIFTTVYDVQWHVTPLHVQKMLLFLLQKGAKDFTVNIGGIFVGSLEYFSKMVETSVSYFTVIYSTQS